MMSTTETPQFDYQKIVAFKIWYSDGSFYSSNDGAWNDAPNDDVQLVMVYFGAKDDLGRFTRLYSSGCDYYALDPVTGQFSSHFDDVSKVTGHILHGKFMNYQKLLELEKAAFDDYGPELIPKTQNELVK